MLRLSALSIGQLYPSGNIPGTHFRHSAARMITSMKNCNDTIGNQISDLPACSTVPQPTALPGEREKKIGRKCSTHVLGERCIVEFSLKAVRNRPLEEESDMNQI